ncbi:MAG: hypothetical protein WDN27_01220 [Candidatus Saccharibacteria bacterium]
MLDRTGIGRGDFGGSTIDIALLDYLGDVVGPALAEPDAVISLLPVTLNVVVLVVL